MSKEEILVFMQNEKTAIFILHIQAIFYVYLFFSAETRFKLTKTVESYQQIKDELQALCTKLA